MRILELTDDHQRAWDDYVRQAPDGLPQHLSGWREVLRQTYGYETAYLAAWRAPDGNGAAPEICGVLPLFLVASPLVGSRMTTPPGGLCADDDEVAEALIAAGVDLARQAKVKQLVLHDTRHAWGSGLETAHEHEGWMVDLRMGADALWKALDRNIRRQVRMAERNGVRVEVDRTGSRLDDFYTVLSHFTHQAGTPIFGRDFLENLVARFTDGFNIVLTYYENQPIGGYFQLELGNTAHGAWGATLHPYLELRPVYLAYWTILSDALGRGVEFLDMGRSLRESNAAHYKSQWGGRAFPIYQQTVSTAGGASAASIAARTQSDRGFTRFRQVWPKLPFGVAQYLGPKLRRHVPFA